MGNRFDPERHRRHSLRLKDFDYTQPGRYFITICTYQRVPIFGEVTGGNMHLNRLGMIAHKEWCNLVDRFPFLELGAFVIMPNHMHGLLGVSENTAAIGMGLKEGKFSPALIAERFGQPVCGSMPTIIRSYKSSVTGKIRLLREQPGHPIWQRNYYEHMVRSDEDWNRIHSYIMNNPSSWGEDRYYPINEE